jgi:hypothetical protein
VRHRMSPFLVSLALVPLASTHAQDAGSGDVVYEIVRDFTHPEAVVVTISGPTTVRTSAGEEYVDPETLTDSDGVTYVLDAYFGQADEADPPISTVTMRRAASRVLSDAELEDAWLRTHPGDDLAGLWDARSRVLGPAPVSPTVVQIDLLAWRATAAPTDTISAIVALRDQPPLDIPRVYGIVDIDPLLALDAHEQRILAVEARKTALEELQADAVATAEASGARVVARGWLVNKFHAELTPAALDALMFHADVRRSECPR